MKIDDLLITGCGVATTIGCNTSKFMNNLSQGFTNFRWHPQIKERDLWKPIVAYLDDTDLEAGIDRRSLRKLDRFSLLSMQAFSQALKHSSLSDQAIHPFGPGRLHENF